VFVTQGPFAYPRNIRAAAAAILPRRRPSQQDGSGEVFVNDICRPATSATSAAAAAAADAAEGARRTGCTTESAAPPAVSRLGVAVQVEFEKANFETGFSRDRYKG
jgi:hypothetical protein